MKRQERKELLDTLIKDYLHARKNSIVESNGEFIETGGSYEVYLQKMWRV